MRSSPISDPTDIGTWTFNVERKDSSGLTLDTSTITIIVTDVCPTSTLALASNVFLNSPTASLSYTLSGTRTLLSWTDAEAVLTTTSGSTTCGLLIWTLTYNGSTLTTEQSLIFSLDSSTGSLSVYSTDPADVGEHPLTVTVALETYPTITASKEFIVSITETETTFTGAFIPDFAYVIDQEPDELTFEEFTFTTTNSVDSYTITYTAT